MGEVMGSLHEGLRVGLVVAVRGVCFSMGRSDGLFAQGEPRTGAHGSDASSTDPSAS